MKVAASLDQSAPSRGKRSPGAFREPRPRKREKLLTLNSSLCKVRKVKCSGNQPCNRCEELHSECTYNEPFQPDNEAFDPQPPNQDLEVTALRMNRICDRIQQSMARFGPPYPSGFCLQRRHASDDVPQPIKPLTPTDFRYNLSLTRDAIRARGLPSPRDSQDDPFSVARDELNSPNTLINLLQAARPILELGHEKVTQLFTIFKDEVHPLYPCISLELGYEAVNGVFLLLKDASHVDIIDVEITKAVVAIALLLRGDTQNSLASDLEAQLAWSVDSCFDQVKPQVEDIILATLLVSYFFRLQAAFSTDERGSLVPTQSIYLYLKQIPVKAWRMAGVAAKLCLELGLHRERFFQDLKVLPQRITDWKRLFACVYRLDKQCSFYSGLPWTLHDRHIDVSALIIEPPESYISTMISLDRNLSEIWTLVNAPASLSKNNEEQVEFLNFQLQKLIDKMPTEDFKSLEPTVVPPSWLQAGLKQFCRLRVHHIKILTHIGTSGSIRDLISDPKSTRTLVAVAAQSVDLHLEMVNTGEISPLVLPTAIKLLLSSLSIMLFAVSHCPEEYGSLYSKRFQAAIDILSDVQHTVKDPDLNILGTLEVMEKITEASQMSHFQRSAPLNNRKEGTDDSVYHGEASGEGNLFEELPTPDSEFFSMLGDFDMAASDILNVDNIFG
ncbi:hypothetical protein N7471_001889 [Penicillium samsonianum]|uniref:uncharacterized protein n=1 Tax=Penicillium samsonianum TaxID=1882272 RepID=UPI0025478EA3|nr:uncharacterized protein N7471_001889 [Penicillium samsonianum]KAJ6142436.1 hypothetical protein N7471_001889 [Penicillium samsonianum]